MLLAWKGDLNIQKLYCSFFSSVRSACSSVDVAAPVVHVRAVDVPPLLLLFDDHLFFFLSTFILKRHFLYAHDFATAAVPGDTY